MNKANKDIVLLIVFITLVILAGLFIKKPVDTKMPAREPIVGGLDIRFKDGISEPEVVAILKNYNMTMNYSIEYNNDAADNYYISVDKDKMMDVKKELEKEKNWTEDLPIFLKGNYYIITISNETVNNKSFINMLSKHDLQLKKYTRCYILFEDKSKNWISEEDAFRIKNELEKNENVYNVHISYRF